jgi:DNA-binding transcriptional ArsR family regulator
MPKQPLRLIDPPLLKALVHPTRIHIMDILSEGENSPSGIQKRIGDISLDLVSKHIKILRDLGVVELCDEVRQRGKFTEHIYRAAAWQFLSVEEWKAVDPDDRPSVTTTILRMIDEDVGRAYFENKFDERVDNHLSRSPLKLDEEGWGEVVKALENALESVLKAHDKSQERAGGEEKKLTDTTVVVMQFPLGREGAGE